MRYLNRPAVARYLEIDKDVLGVIETKQDELYTKTARKRVEPWHLYLCSEVVFASESSQTPNPNPATAAYLLCGDEFTYSEFSLEWSNYHQCWYVRTVEAREGAITHDTEDEDRCTSFDEAWKEFCGAAAETEAIRAMQALYVKQKQQPKSPLVDKTPRPSIFGTWS